jgi:hypothetical protein
MPRLTSFVEQRARVALLAEWPGCRLYAMMTADTFNYFSHQHYRNLESRAQNRAACTATDCTMRVGAFFAYREL